MNLAVCDRGVDEVSGESGVNGLGDGEAIVVEVVGFVAVSAEGAEGAGAAVKSGVAVEPGMGDVEEGRKGDAKVGVNILFDGLGSGGRGEECG